MFVEIMIEKSVLLARCGSSQEAFAFLIVCRSLAFTKVTSAILVQY